MELCVIVEPGRRSSPTRLERTSAIPADKPVNALAKDNSEANVEPAFIEPMHASRRGVADG